MVLTLVILFLYYILLNKKSVWECALLYLLLHPKLFPLLSPVFGEAFAEFGKGECGGFFAVEDGFDDVRSEVDKAQCPEEEGTFLFYPLGKIGKIVATLPDFNISRY